MRTFFYRLWRFFRNRALDRQLEDELQFHLDMETEKNRRRGMTPQEAASAARRAFGGMEPDEGNLSRPKEFADA